MNDITPPECIIRLVGQATGETSVHDGKWLESYDPDGNFGMGSLTSTWDFRKALKFPTAADAMNCWRRSSTKQPFRADGRPNRPLTAYTVELLPFSGEQLL